MKSVRDILRTKEITHTYSVQPHTKVLDAIKVMADKGIGALLVLDNQRLVGVLSERDYARKVILMARSSHTAEVREIMSSDLITVTLDESIEYCMELMTEKRLRHLPVLDGEKVLGIISIGDIVKNIISHQEYLIRQLEGYIKGEHA